MKKVWSSVFQTVSQSVKTLSANVNKKICHDVVMMTTGISVVTMLTFTAGELSGNGQSAMVAYAETHVQTVEVGTELENADYEEINDLLMGREHNKNDLPLLLEHEFAIFEDHAEMIQDEEETMSSEEQTTEDVSEETTKEETKAIINEDVTSVSEDIVESIEEKTEEATDEGIVLNGDEYQVLLRIVQAEAGTCDEEGKLLVANVILNRMECEEFPDTVRGVVYQKRQFSPVMNGTINTCKITMETRNAVNRALSGEDISEGALYFMNRSKSAGRNVRWFDANLQYLFKHGEHEFFR